MQWSTKSRGALWALCGLAGLVMAAPATANGRTAMYEVEITNVTPGQTFTPLLVVTHSSAVSLFTPGQPAGEPLEILAEAGDTTPLSDALGAASGVGEAVTIPGLLGPGQTATVHVQASRHTNRISVAAMLIPTNDTFVGLDAARLPFIGDQLFEVPAWDAGTEENDQSCAHIPGPRCGGEGHSPGPNEGDEGFVHVSNGFHDLGDVDDEEAEVLGPVTYDWNDPVAHIRVRRIR